MCLKKVKVRKCLSTNKHMFHYCSDMLQTFQELSHFCVCTTNSTTDLLRLSKIFLSWEIVPVVKTPFQVHWHIANRKYLWNLTGQIFYTILIIKLCYSLIFFYSQTLLSYFSIIKKRKKKYLYAGNLSNS